jgi:hypothetical protein
VGRDLALRYLRAVADLPHDRRAALADLEACFRDAQTPDRIEGTTRGRVVTTTLGWGVDAIVGGLARLWRPWHGKSFDPEVKEGRNLFSSSFRPVLRLLWPSYELERSEGPGRFSAFPFTTWEGTSAFTPGGSDVLKIDYEHPQSPWLVRDVLDELVQIDEGLFLGQALLRVRGRLHRVAWFELRSAAER